MRLFALRWKRTNRVSVDDAQLSDGEMLSAHATLVFTRMFLDCYALEKPFMGGGQPHCSKKMPESGE